MDHRQFTLMVILVTFCALTGLGTLFVLDRISGTAFFGYMLATIPLMALIRAICCAAKGKGQDGEPPSSPNP